MKHTTIVLIISLLFGKCLFSQSYPGGHSHNDYYQEHPLFDALENGMASIEADVFLYNKKILVGHNKKDLNNNKSLDALYLAPLFDLTSKSTDFKTVILLVDIKENGEKVYKALKKLLEPYTPMLTHFENGTVHQGAVTIIISGSRPIETIKKENDRYVFIDGRISDIPNNEPTNAFPLISDDWTDHFTWNGKGHISDEERIKLEHIVKQCHAQGKIVRFWGLPGSPNTENAWKVLLNAHVDLIGCDCPKCLKVFMEVKAHK